MRVEIRSRVKSDANAVQDKYIAQELEEFIRDALASDITALMQRYNFKPLRHDSSFYRLRLDDYRLGCRYDQSSNTLVIMRLLHRQVVYKLFP